MCVCRLFSFFRVDSFFFFFRYLSSSLAVSTVGDEELIGRAKQVPPGFSFPISFCFCLFVCFVFFLLWLTFVKRFLFLFLFARSSPVVGRSRARRVSQRIGRFHRRDRFPNFFGGGRYPKRLKGGGQGVLPRGQFSFSLFFFTRGAFWFPDLFLGRGVVTPKG